MDGGARIPNRPSQQRDRRLGVAHGRPTARQRMEALDFIRCEVCGEVIGVYEPLVVYDGDSGRTTSRAAEPDLRAGAAGYSHRDCDATAQEPERRTASGNG